jgi:hypothetical protein
MKCPRDSNITALYLDNVKIIAVYLNTVKIHAEIISTVLKGF